jgi:hypothetical protein
VSDKRRTENDGDVIIGPLAHEIIDCLKTCQELLPQIDDDASRDNRQDLITRISNVLALHEGTAKILANDPSVGIAQGQQKSARKQNRRSSLRNVFRSRFWFEMTTPPLRSRVEARYMYPEFIKDDQTFERLRDQQFEDWRRLFDQ